MLKTTAAARSSNANPTDIAHVLRHARLPNMHKPDPMSRWTALKATLTAALLDLAESKGIYVDAAGGAVAMYLTIDIVCAHFTKR